MTKPFSVLLIVGDSPIVCAEIQRSIGDAYTCTAAPTAAEARAVCRAHVPDAVVVDERLPDGAGLALLAEYTLRRKDTGETWIGSYNFAPIHDADGAIVGAVAVGRDITRRERATLLAGQISLDTMPGEGTTIRVSLPLTTPAGA